MKQVLYVSTAVLALAFVIAFYYRLSIGNEMDRTTSVVHASKANVSQKCPCDFNLIHFNWSAFTAPAVRPPLRADIMPALPVDDCAEINQVRTSANVTEGSQKTGAIASVSR